jgi:hypothetical protein
MGTVGEMSKMLQERLEQLARDIKRGWSPGTPEFPIASEHASLILNRIPSLVAEVEQETKMLQQALREIANWTMHSGSAYSDLTNYSQSYYLIEKEVAEARRIAKEALTEESWNEYNEFEKGQRVRVIERYDGPGETNIGPDVGEEGCIVYIRTGSNLPFLVEMDNSFPGGHKAGQGIKRGHGWWFPKTGHLELLPESVTDTPLRDQLEQLAESMYNGHDDFASKMLIKNIPSLVAAAGQAPEPNEGLEKVVEELADSALDALHDEPTDEGKAIIRDVQRRIRAALPRIAAAKANAAPVAEPVVEQKLEGYVVGVPNLMWMTYESAAEHATQMLDDGEIDEVIIFALHPFATGKTTRTIEVKRVES